MTDIHHAKEAVEGLLREEFVVATYGYDERDQQAYHEHYWGRLVEAVGVTAQACPLCGQWYGPGSHTCS